MSSRNITLWPLHVHLELDLVAYTWRASPTGGCIVVTWCLLSQTATLCTGSLHPWECKTWCRLQGAFAFGVLQPDTGYEGGKGKGHSEPFMGKWQPTGREG
jgi:hypothetical protein